MRAIEADRGGLSRFSINDFDYDSFHLLQVGYDLKQILRLGARLYLSVRCKTKPHRAEFLGRRGST